MNPPHPNTRKQSDLLKSEESHRSEIGQVSDKYLYCKFKKKDKFPQYWRFSNNEGN
jgi:hypothetical protein